MTQSTPNVEEIVAAAGPSTGSGSSTGSGRAAGSGDNGATRDAETARSRPWPVTALGLFLLLQMVGLAGLAAFQVLIADPQTGDLTADLGNILGILYLLLAWLALISAVGFFRRWLNSWLMAMLLQGLCLLFALILYFQSRPDYAYGVMVYAIFMVIYLNHYEVRDAFHAHKLLMTDPEEWIT